MRIDWQKKIYVAVIGIDLIVFIGWWAIIRFTDYWYSAELGISFHNLLVLLLIALALILSSIVALLLASFINHFLLGGWFSRQEERAQTTVDTFWASISAASDWPRDELARALATSKGAQSLKQDLDKLHDNRQFLQRSRQGFQIVEWYNTAKFLYKLGRICRDGRHIRIEEVVRQRYILTRQCIRIWLGTHTLKFAAPLSLFIAIWYGIFFLLWSWVDTTVFLKMRDDAPELSKSHQSPEIFSHLVNITINTDPQALFPDWTAIQIFAPFLLLLGALLFAFLTLNLVQFFVRWFTEKSWTDFDDIIVGISSGPISAIILAMGFYQAGLSIPPTLAKATTHYWTKITSPAPIRTLLILVAVWFTVYVFNQIIVLALEKWAARTDQKSDDMFVRIIQVFGTFLIVAAGLGALIVSYDTELKSLGLDNILLPYSILVSVFTAILGYASQEAIQNFFGGVLLQVDKPFEIGERLVLQSGDLVDVREVGMRSTRLYNVRTNSEMSIPNSLMSTQIINNVSRPDVEQRIQIHVHIPHEGRNLRKAEAILWDIAYLEGEVDQMRVRAQEVPIDVLAMGRIAIQEELRRLESTYPKIKQTNVYRIIGGKDVIGNPVFPKVYEFLLIIADLRTKYISSAPLNFGYFHGQLKIQDIKNIHSLFPEDKRTNYDDFPEFDSLVWELIDRLIPDIRQGTVLTNIRGETIKLLKRTGALKQDLTEEAERTRSLEDLIRSQFSALNSSQPLPQKSDPNTESVSPSFWVVFSDLLSEIYHDDRYKESKRLQIVEHIEYYYGKVGDELYAIGETFAELRPELDKIRAEMTKEPAITSEFCVTEDGASYIKITFSVFGTHLERQPAVVHKLNRAIVRRFQRAEIPLYTVRLGGSMAPKNSHLLLGN